MCRHDAQYCTSRSISHILSHTHARTRTRAHTHTHTHTAPVLSLMHLLLSYGHSSSPSTSLVSVPFFSLEKYSSSKTHSDLLFWPKCSWCWDLYSVSPITCPVLSPLWLPMHILVLHHLIRIALVSMFVWVDIYTPRYTKYIYSTYIHEL